MEGGMLLKGTCPAACKALLPSDIDRLAVLLQESRKYRVSGPYLPSANISWVPEVQLLMKLSCAEGALHVYRLGESPQHKPIRQTPQRHLGVSPAACV